MYTATDGRLVISEETIDTLAQRMGEFDASSGLTMTYTRDGELLTDEELEELEELSRHYAEMAIA
jgi:hypothetical protein